MHRIIRKMNSNLNEANRGKSSFSTFSVRPWMHQNLCPQASTGCVQQLENFHKICALVISANVLY